MKVNTLAAALKAEVRRLAAKEVQKGLRALRAIQRQMKKLRLAARANRRGLRSVERAGPWQFPAVLTAYSAPAGVVSLPGSEPRGVRWRSQVLLHPQARRHA